MHKKLSKHLLMSLAPEECSRRIFKGSDESKSTGNENEGVGENHSSDGGHGTTDVHSSGSLSSRNACQKVSQLVDKPVDKVPANVQYPIEGNSQQINEALQGMHSIRVGVTGPDQVCVSQFKDRSCR
jgi:hypothetical protein